jgi:hypothetical protein
MLHDSLRLFTISRQFPKVKRSIDNNYDLCSSRLFVECRFKLLFGHGGLRFGTSDLAKPPDNLYVNEETLSNARRLGERFSSRSLFAREMLNGF